MNGFAVASLQTPGLLSRLLGRKVEANAFIEIQNLLTTDSVLARPFFISV